MMSDNLLLELQNIELNINKFTDNFTSNSILTCTKLYAEGKLKHYNKFKDNKTLNYKDCIFVKTGSSSGGYLTEKNNAL